MFTYVSLGTNDLARAARFYDAALGALGLRRCNTSDEGDFGDWIGWGTYEDGGATELALWVCEPFDGRPATVGNGTIAQDGGNGGAGGAAGAIGNGGRRGAGGSGVDGTRAGRAAGTEHRVPAGRGRSRVPGISAVAAGVPWRQRCPASLWQFTVARPP